MPKLPKPVSTYQVVTEKIDSAVAYQVVSHTNPGLNMERYAMNLGKDFWKIYNTYQPSVIITVEKKQYYGVITGACKKCGKITFNIQTCNINNTSGALHTKLPEGSYYVSMNVDDCFACLFDPSGGIFPYGGI